MEILEDLKSSVQFAQEAEALSRAPVYHPGTLRTPTTEDRRWPDRWTAAHF
jgi:hypothetical protein